MYEGVEGTGGVATVQLFEVLSQLQQVCIRFFCQLLT